MAIRGQTKNIAQSAQSAKDLNPVETLVPFHIDLRNGHLTPALNWERRPGLFLQWTVTAPTVTVTPPLPPTPPGGGGGQTCPDQPTVTHVDSGFTSIANATAIMDKTTSFVYYMSNGAIADPSVPTGFAAGMLQSFDMTGPAVQYNSLGTGRSLRDPYIDSASRLWAIKWGTSSGVLQRLVELDPTDSGFATLNEDTSNDYSIGDGVEIRVGTTVVYIVNTSSGYVWIFNKTTLALVGFFRPDLDYGTTGTQPKFQHGQVDGSGNLWVTVKTRNGFAANNRLMQIDSSGALLQDYDLTAEYASANVSIDLMFDSITNSLILTGGSYLKQWDITSGTVLNTTTPFNFIDGATTANGLYQSKFWYFNAPTATAFIEFDVSTWSITQTVLLTDMSGITTVYWANPIWMPGINCLHVNHGVISTPTGGVDEICLPC